MSLESPCLLLDSVTIGFSYYYFVIMIISTAITSTHPIQEPMDDQKSPILLPVSTRIVSLRPSSPSRRKGVRQRPFRIPWLTIYVTPVGRNMTNVSLLVERSFPSPSSPFRFPLFCPSSQPEHHQEEKTLKRNYGYVVPSRRTS